DVPLTREAGPLARVDHVVPPARIGVPVEHVLVAEVVGHGGSVCRRPCFARVRCGARLAPVLAGEVDAVAAAPPAPGRPVGPGRGRGAGLGRRLGLLAVLAAAAPPAPAPRLARLTGVGVARALALGGAAGRLAPLPLPLALVAEVLL